MGRQVCTDFCCTFFGSKAIFNYLKNSQFKYTVFAYLINIQFKYTVFDYLINSQFKFIGFGYLIIRQTFAHHF